MSTHPSKNDPSDQPHGHQTEDAVDYFKVVLVGVASLVVFAIATWWAAIILRHETAHVRETSGETKPVEIGATEIGIVDQVPFISDHRLEEWQTERHAYLNGYGWVDKGKGVVHIPIDKAMEQVLGGALPAGAPK